MHGHSLSVYTHQDMAAVVVVHLTSQAWMQEAVACMWGQH